MIHRCDTEHSSLVLVKCSQINTLPFDVKQFGRCVDGVGVKSVESGRQVPKQTGSWNPQHYLRIMYCTSGVCTVLVQRVSFILVFPCYYGCSCDVCIICSCHSLNIYSLNLLCLVIWLYYTVFTPNYSLGYNIYMLIEYNCIIYVKTLV